MIRGFVSNAVVMYFDFQTIKILNSVCNTTQKTKTSSNIAPDNENSTLKLKPPFNLTLLFNQFNDLSTESNKIYPNKVSTLNVILTKFKTSKLNSLSLFYINTSSLSKMFEDFECLLRTTNMTFGIIAFSESRITKELGLTKNIHPNIILWNIRQLKAVHLSIYKSLELESTLNYLIKSKLEIIY